jgi:hypothetical protein
MEAENRFGSKVHFFKAVELLGRNFKFPLKVINQTRCMGGAAAHDHGGRYGQQIVVDLKKS